MNKRDKHITSKNTSLDKIHQPTIQVMHNKSYENDGTE